MRLEITDLKDDNGNGKSCRKDRPNKGIDSQFNVFFVLRMNFIYAYIEMLIWDINYRWIFIDIDEWNYLDDSSDDGWVEENDDFTFDPERKEKERIDSLQDLIEENDSPKKGNW